MAGLTRTQFEERNEEATRLVERIAFLRDAFDGSGGFASLPLSQTVSSNGALANIPDWATSTYLLKHEGENWKQFEARRLISRYVNHCRRGIEHLIGLLVRRPPTRSQDQHPAIQALLKDCDGAGTTWDSMRERALTRAGLYPGIPWTVDRPFDPGARTAAENKGTPRFSLREPDTLRDWRIDSQRQPLWMKFVEELDEKKGPTDEGRKYLRATIWYRDKFEVWEMDTSGNAPPSLKRREKNKLGVVPAGVLTFADAVCVADLFGWSPGGELADVAGADFNDLSRLTDFLARGTFPMFLVPIEQGDQEEVQDLEVGTMTAYGYSQEATHAPDWAKQDPHPIDAHNKRREINEAEGLRSVGLESLLRTTNVPSSALAKKYENQHLDGSLRRVGQRGDRWERDVVRLWLLLWGETPERADKILAEYKNESPESYDIEDLDSLILQAQGALGLPGTDPYTQKAILVRVSDAIAKLSPEDKEEREKYLSAQLKAALIGENEEDAPPEPPVPPEGEGTEEGTKEPGAAEAEEGADEEPEAAQSQAK